MLKFSMNKINKLSNGNIVLLIPENDLDNAKNALNTIIGFTNLEGEPGLFQEPKSSVSQANPGVHMFELRLNKGVSSSAVLASLEQFGIITEKMAKTIDPSFSSVSGAEKQKKFS